LSGISGDGFSLGIGELLCALSGIFYGVNIAGTSVFTKKFDAALYIMILLLVESVLSLVVSLAFNFILINGVPVETIKFSFNPLLLLSRIAVVLISSTLCWVIRTNSMKHVDATVVAVMMPFSSIIAGILSVLFGMDELSTNLVIGAVLGFTAMIICAFGDMHADKKYKQKLTADKMDSPAKDDILEN
jgi:drug/metabolite transporter (DMT)-like permease